MTYIGMDVPRSSFTFCFYQPTAPPAGQTPSQTCGPQPDLDRFGPALERR